MNSSSTNDDGTRDERGTERVLRSTSLKDLLAAPFPVPEYLMEGLIPKAQNGYVHVDADADPQMFAVAVSCSLAAGRRLHPFGASAPTVVFFASRTGSLSRLREQIGLFHDQLPNPLVRNRAKANFFLHHHQIGGEPVGCLNDKFDQDILFQSLPKDCGLVLFLDSARLMASKRDQDVLTYRQFHRFLTDLNKAGIATLTFYQAHRKATAELEDEILSDGANYLLALRADPAAPRDYGGGLIVERRKMSEFDTVPTRFSFWYTVIDRKLNYGWEIRDWADATTAKNVEMTERRNRVRELAGMGMKQKEIAAALNVDQATVSRDVAKIKAEDRSNGEQPASFDDEDAA